MKFDHDFEEEDLEFKSGKKRKVSKIIFENPLKNDDFLSRIDFTNFTIKQKVNDQSGELFTDAFFTILKS